jgi:hypothetical protein
MLRARSFSAIFRLWIAAWLLALAAWMTLLLSC